jgi:hypothetical protein
LALIGTEPFFIILLFSFIALTAILSWLARLSPSKGWSQAHKEPNNNNNTIRWTNPSKKKFLLPSAFFAIVLLIELLIRNVWSFDMGN